MNTAFSCSGRATRCTAPFPVCAGYAYAADMRTAIDFRITAMAAIATVAIVVAGVIGPFVFNAAIDDTFVRTALPWMFILVAVVSFVQMRCFVLPRQTATPAASTAASLPELARSVGVLCATFAVSTALYGLVAGIIVDAWWFAPAFGVFALLELSIYVSYANERLAALQQRMNTGG